MSFPLAREALKLMRETLGVTAVEPRLLREVAYEQLEEAALYALIYLAENMAYSQGRRLRTDYENQQSPEDDRLEYDDGAAT